VKTDDLLADYLDHYLTLTRNTPLRPAEIHINDIPMIVHRKK